uniref:Uncharacterized protein n=1 Tax=Odontella aurita TaxID=265563 RepID=A0A7S4MI51_9STRA|mmetsp:Transcript_22212/g.65812  ORF Transcript_22212/g.65812 Transcript_22212/m.65812 type:complete len:127 (+) Transcript_22212:637-1017(+)
MIPRCTGRYTCRDHDTASGLSSWEFLARVGIDNVRAGGDNNQAPLGVERRFRLPNRSDDVVVVPLDDRNETGVITFVKKEEDDGTVRERFVHTFNTRSGFRRKLEAIGLKANEDSVFQPGLEASPE